MKLKKSKVRDYNEMEKHFRIPTEFLSYMVRLFQLKNQTN